MAFNVANVVCCWFVALNEDSKKVSVFTVASKQMLLWKPPSILTLHLKRFEQVGRGLRKVNKFIEFPMNLDLSPFCYKSDQVCIFIEF